MDRPGILAAGNCSSGSFGLRGEVLIVEVFLEKMENRDGLVVLIDATPTGYKELGSFMIPNVEHPSWPHPVIADGKLYLREQDTLYVYDVSAAGAAKKAS